MSSPREREKRDRRESRGDEREGQGRKKNRNESEESYIEFSVTVSYKKIFKVFYIDIKGK